MNKLRTTDISSKKTIDNIQIFPSLIMLWLNINKTIYSTNVEF